MKNSKTTEDTMNGTEMASATPVKSNRGRTSKSARKAVTSESPLTELKEGDFCKFGSYYQEDSEKKTPIEWRVMQKDGTKVLLMSRYALDCKQYHREKADITWECSDLRKWLNDEFLRSAFSDEEQKKIAVTNLKNVGNPRFYTSGGNSTKDNVFCLDLSQVQKLFKDIEDLRCVPTPYAKSKGVSVSPLESKGYCWWWLRSPGYCQSDAVNVFADGYVNLSGSEVNFDNFAVRPVLWIKTGSQKKKADTERMVNVELEHKQSNITDKASFEDIMKDVFCKFGSYYQENCTEKTPIEWRVLKKSDSKALLISRYCLDRRQYHHEWTDITWENSDLRKWLNEDFLQSAFSKEEQKKIAVTKIANEGNSKYGTDGGNITEDRIFCLSIEEAKNLFESDEVRKCGFVPKWWKFADSCWWWLRSPGLDQDNAALVLGDGVISLNGSNVSQSSQALRPALWVDLDLLGECDGSVKSSESADGSTASDDAVQDLYDDDLYEDNYCTFGSYCRQNGSKKVPIEWLVLKRSGASVLLISRYGLDYKPYHHECTDITWEHCDLRKWLNEKFLDSAFSDEEQEAIQVTELANYDNTKYGTLGGNSTKDRIFCLSIAEVNSLFDDDARKCRFVPDANGMSEGCLWQLRSPGDYQNVATGVDFDGELIMRGYRVDSACYALRPALWVRQDHANTLKLVENENYIRFGCYYRKNNSNKSPIEWRVLKRFDNKVLLISRYGLDCKQYHHECVNITWENCDLRKWLNGEFFRNAFSEAEQKKIVVTELVNDNNPKNDTSGGNSTEDRVFCLSLSEAESLFENNDARKCVPTSYAAEKGAEKSNSSLIDGRGCCSWWLRTPNTTQKDVLTSDEYGRLSSPYVRDIHCKSIAVRPALWVNL